MGHGREAVGELSREGGTGEGGEPLDLRDVRDRHDARNDRHGAAGGDRHVDEPLVVLHPEEQLGDGEFRPGLLLERQDPGILLEAGRFGVALREGGHADTETAERSDQLDQLDGVVESAGMRLPGSVEAGGRVPAQRQEGVDSDGRVLAHHVGQLVAARPDAGEVRDGGQRRLAGDLAGDPHRPVARGAPGAVGHRDECRAQGLDVADRLPEHALTVVGLRREQLERERPLPRRQRLPE